MRRTQEKFSSKCKKGRRAKFALFGAGESTINGLHPFFTKKRPRPSRNVKTSYDREDHVEDQEIKLENKEEQLNQLRKHWKRKRTKSEPEKDRLKMTKTVSYLTGRAPDGQRARLAEVL